MGAIESEKRNEISLSFIGMFSTFSSVIYRSPLSFQYGPNFNKKDYTAEA